MRRKKKTPKSAQPSTCKRFDGKLDALDRIGQNPIARRELLWLRAKEKEDRSSARDFERADPLLAARLEAMLDPELFGFDPRLAYAKLYDERYDAHAGPAVACSCMACFVRENEDTCACCAARAAEDRRR